MDQNAYARTLSVDEPSFETHPSTVGRARMPIEGSW